MQRSVSEVDDEVTEGEVVDQTDGQRTEGVTDSKQTIHEPSFLE